MIPRRCSSNTAAALLLATAISGCASNAGLTPPAASVHVDAHPDAQALLYVSEPALNRVLIYTFPGLRPRGSLTGLYHAEGLCVDGTSGNVWVVEPAFRNRVVEFAHGSTTPIRTLTIPSALLWDPLESTCRHASLSIL